MRLTVVVLAWTRELWEVPLRGTHKPVPQRLCILTRQLYFDLITDP